MGMRIHLTPELEQFVQEQVRRGHYRSTSEVVGAALAQWAERDREGKWPLGVSKVDLDQFGSLEGSPLDMKSIKPKVRRLAA